MPLAMRDRTFNHGRVRILAAREGPMSGLGCALDRSRRVVGMDGDLPRDGSAPVRVLQ